MFSDFLGFKNVRLKWMDPGRWPPVIRILPDPVTFPSQA